MISLQHASAGPWHASLFGHMMAAVTDCRPSPVGLAEETLGHPAVVARAGWMLWRRLLRNVVLCRTVCAQRAAALAHPTAADIALS
jgi:hypothetical protein